MTIATRLAAAIAAPVRRSSSRKIRSDVTGKMIVRTDWVWIAANVTNAGTVPRSGSKVHSLQSGSSSTLPSIVEIHVRERPKSATSAPAALPSRMSRPTRGSRKRPSSTLTHEVSIRGHNRRAYGSIAR